jgi:L-ascorbate metabolism protein UlaG (beta-lactamase superfamily)
MNENLKDKTFETDTFDVGGQTLRVTALGHSSLVWHWRGQVIHVDPWGVQADYSTQPKADFIFVTHEHMDHFDQAAIALIRKPGTRLFVNPAVRALLGEGEALANGDSADLGSFSVEAHPAYNLGADKQKFHPKGRDNGYLFRFGKFAVYVAGDTEDTPELLALRGLDAAFLPMNQPYTMTPEQVARVARTVRPRVLYPYHRGETDPQLVAKLLKDEPGVEVRIRRLA